MMEILDDIAFDVSTLLMLIGLGVVAFATYYAVTRGLR